VLASFCSRAIVKIGKGHRPEVARGAPLVIFLTNYIILESCLDQERLVMTAAENFYLMSCRHCFSLFLLAGTAGTLQALLEHFTFDTIPHCDSEVDSFQP
jgi:hypothetical protein